jgi:uncharacterized repeat protein (TIGR03803 family)
MKSTGISGTLLRALAVLALAGPSSANLLAASPVETQLYAFQNGLDGSGPWGALVADRFGNLYGTTISGGAFGYGTVYELTPPIAASGSWTETMIYAFQNGADGAQPYSSLIFDEQGNLYGTTNGGGNAPDCFECGTVFKLSPPSTPGTGWTESILYTFDGNDGAYPYAGLLVGEGGRLYGTTHTGGLYFGGAVFQLTPPDDTTSGPWKERVLYSFTGGADGGGPYAGLIRDAAGNLYGTTNYGGTAGFGAAFRLARPKGGSGGWTENVIYSFTGGSDGAGPFAGLIFDTQGKLYGTAAIGANQSCPGGGCGTIFRLAPPQSSAGSWSEQTLYSFTGSADGGQPNGTPVMDARGRLFGTATVGGLSPVCQGVCGAVFELSPPTTRRGTWTETTLHGFMGSSDGSYPISGVILGKGGVLFGTAVLGGDSEGDGLAFEVTP